MKTKMVRFMKKLSGFLKGLLNNLNFLLKILRWKEYWIVVFVASGVFGVWIVFYLAILLPHPWRAIVFWGILIALAALAPERR